MKLNEMIFVIENWKGVTETNSIMTLDDTIKFIEWSGAYSMKETAEIFSELGKTLTEPDWAEVYLSGNKTIYMSYCKDEKHFQEFLNKKFNDKSISDIRFDYRRCSTSCKEILRKYGVGKNRSEDVETGRKEFDIEVSELLSRTIKVEAETLGDAIEHVMEQYKKGEIVLDAEDFVENRIEEKQKCY